MTDTTSRPRAIVTGATSGMGAHIARDLATTHEVLALGRSAAALAELDALDGVTALRVDLTDPVSLATTLGDLGRVDVLVHAAAVADRFSVEQADPAEWNRQFTTNVIAPAELTRLALPALRESEGTVVFIGSGAGTKPVPGSVIYAATKHALKAVADSLRIEEEPHRVRVVTIAPGQTDTPMLRKGAERGGETYEADRYIRPESVARAVRFVVDASSDVQLTDIAVRPRQEVKRL